MTRRAIPDRRPHDARSKPTAKAATPLDAALDAVRALAIDTLHGERTTRFHDAATLCSLGQALVRVFGDRVEDFELNNVQCGGMGNPFLPVQNVAFAGGGMPRMRPAALLGQDQQDVRNVALGMDDMLRIQTDTARAQAAAAAAAELKDLLAVRAKLPKTARSAVTARLTTLVAHLETQHAAPPPAPPAPVFGPLLDAGAPLPVVQPRPPAPDARPVVRAERARGPAPGGRGDEATRLTLTRLSRLERAALAGLRTWAVAQDLHRARGGGRASRLLFPEVTDDLGATETETHIMLAAPLDAIQKVLARLLKPTRVLVGVVHYTDGTLAEVSRSEPVPTPSVDGGAIGPASGAYREVPPPAAPATPKKKETAKIPDAGATVAAPTIGCPPPNFPAREERANRVLERFLTPAQYADWRRDQRFVQTAHDTGHKYLLTSRLHRDALSRVGGRSLFDLDTQTPFCTHDWDVPAAEELLALRVFLALPGGEAYLRAVPADPYLGR